MKNFIILLYSCCSGLLSAQQTWYVNHAAAGANNGLSWSDAFNSLQAALEEAQYGDQIWVAQGTYLPTADNNREVSFDLPRGVRLYGGFAGTETMLSQRNHQIHKTILSGEIGDPAVWTDNVYHVLTMYRSDSNTVLDGFSIMHGYGNDAFSGFPHEYGGGVLAVADPDWPVATPIITNCRFERNRSGSGGGLACIGYEETVCSPSISNCTFIQNRCGYSGGGGLYKLGPNLPDKAFQVDSCLFEKNRSFYLGGGALIEGASDTVRFTNCTFLRDTAIEGGGLLFLTGPRSIRYEVEDCHFTANYVNSAAGGGLEQLLGVDPYVEKIEFVVRKCRFFLNRSGIGGSIASYTRTGVQLHRVQVEQCNFENNNTQNGGAGILIEGGGGVYTEASVDRCLFFGNKTGASSAAGAFYHRSWGGGLIRSQSTITNSVFMFNDGAIAAFGGNPGISHTRVANCSFYKNGEIPFVKYWGTDSNPVDLVMKMQILNSVIWEPQTEGVHRLFYNNNPVNFTVNDYLVEHSLIHLPDCSYNGFDPCGEGMIYDTWPDFVDAESGNTLEMWWCSPAQNTGSNLVADTFGLAKDFWGNSRIFEDTVDMGAYEIQTYCTSGTGTAALVTLPVGVRLLGNPVLKSEQIKVELFAVLKESLRVQLTEAQGGMVWQGSVHCAASQPTVLSIPSDRLRSGIYYLQVMDKQGRSKTEKVVVME